MIFLKRFLLMLTIALSMFAFTLPADAATVEVVSNNNFASLTSWTAAASTANSVAGTCSYNGVTAPGTETLTFTAGFPALGGTTTTALGSVSLTAIGFRSCVLYQDVAIPAGATTAVLTIDTGIKLVGGLASGDTAIFAGLYSTASVPSFNVSSSLAGTTRLIIGGATAGVVLTPRTSVTWDVSTLAGTTVRLAILNVMQSTSSGTGAFIPGAGAVVGLGRASLTVTVPNPPLLTPSCTLTATPSTIASGASSTLAVTCTPAAATYAWSNSLFASTASGGTVSPASTTTYSVLGSNANGNGNLAEATVNVIPQVDVRSYFPAAAGSSVSALRVINTGTLATPVFAARIDGATGQVGNAVQLASSLAAGGATTFSAQQVEAALGASLSASDRPRIRISGTGSMLEVQSLLQTGAVLSDITTAQSGSSVMVSSYVPASAASSGYVSSLRVINTGTTASAVTIAKIDGATGLTGAAATLTSSLPAGAAITYTAAQIEATLGFSMAASDRPRLLVSAANTTLDVQSFLQQPGNALTEVSTGQSGASIDVRSYVPAARSAYTSFLRVINESNAATPITAAVLNQDDGSVLASGTLIASLPANAALTLTASQVEAALGIALPVDSRPRIRITSPAGTAALRMQSFLLQPDGAFNEISNAVSNASVKVRTYFPAADAANGTTSYLRVINTAATSTPLILSVIDPVSGALQTSVMLAQAFPAGAAQTFSSAQIEAALGITLAAGSRPRIQINGLAGLEVQSFLLQAGGAFIEVSGGQ